MTVKTFIVTVVSTGGGNKYFVDGVQQATVALARGATYQFDQSDSSNATHPLVFSSDSGNSTPYTTGVTTNGTPGSGGAYTQISVATDAPATLYYYCSNHANMGGQANLSSQAWGSLAWSQNAWQSTINNIPVSGIGATFSLGNEVAFPGSGWGANSWNVGEWGSVNTGNQLVTGFSLSANLGQVEQSSSTGWGRLTWGTSVWNGYGTVIPASNSMSMSLDNNVLIDTEINAGWGRLGWNVNSWGVRGQVGATGQAMTMSLDDVVIDNEINTGWGSDGWGVEGWGASIQVVDVAGQTMTAFEGSAGLAFDGDSNVTPTGNPLTLTQGDEEAFASFVAEPTGLPMTISVSYDPEVITTGSLPMSIALGTAIGDNITVAEISAQSAVTWGNSNWGFGVYGNQQVNTLVMAMQENFSGADPAPDAEATGQAMAMNLSPISNFNITGDATTRVLTAMGWSNATWGESKWGNGTFLAVPDVTFSLAANLGTAVLDANTIPTITGLTNLFTNVGTLTATGTGKVIPTGNLLTMGLGTATNVLIWNGVDPGTAPIDPPGWKPVNTNAA